MAENDELVPLEYEQPYNLAEVRPARIDAPPEQRKCSQCGVNSQALAASDLTVIRHRHASQPDGHLRLYCSQHLAGAKEWQSSGGLGLSGKAGPVCPRDFITVPLGTGICEICGKHVDS